MAASPLVKARLPLEKEVSQLYQEVLHSLEDGAATYSIDDYLAGVSQLHRNPTKCGSNAVYYTAEGVDHSRSLTYLLNMKSGYLDAHYFSGKSVLLRQGSYGSLVAEKLVGAALAMRIVAEKADRSLPIDVSLILLGSEGERNSCEYFNAKSLREASMENRGSTRHESHIVIVEPTGLRVCNVQKGCLIFRLAIEGRPRSPALAWLGGNPWDALTRFLGNTNDFMEPRHGIYPVELGKASPSTLSSFLIGFPTTATLQVRSDRPDAEGGGSFIESYHYVSLPPEFSCEQLMQELITVSERVEKGTGCKTSIHREYFEEPFREDPRSPVVHATSNAVLKTSGFEPIFEWLPFPVSARKLEVDGFAKDVVVFGPGDWAPTNIPNRKSIVEEILQASEILAMIPSEAAALEEDHSREKRR